MQVWNLKHYSARPIPKKLEEFVRENPGKIGFAKDVNDAILTQNQYGKVCVIHGSNGFHPLPEDEKLHKNQLVLDTPDSHSLFAESEFKDLFPLAPKKIALYMEGVHLNYLGRESEYDLVYGSIPNVNSKYFRHKLENKELTYQEIIEKHMVPFVVNSFIRAIMNECKIMILDGFYEEHRIPKKKTEREEYLRELDFAIDYEVKRFSKYVKYIFITGKD